MLDAVPGGAFVGAPNTLAIPPPPKIDDPVEVTADCSLGNCPLADVVEAGLPNGPELDDPPKIDSDGRSLATLENIGLLDPCCC